MRYIDTCQYREVSIHSSHAATQANPDRPGRAAAAGPRTSDPALDRARADGHERGLRVRLHVVLRRAPADGVPPPPDPEGGGRHRVRAAWNVDLLPARPGRGRTA